MKILYTIGIYVFYGLMGIASVFKVKARLWISGRSKWKKKIKNWDSSGPETFWFHAASLGEFEQGLPVIEELKREKPECRIFLTFYSPSGYEIRKNYHKADFVSYLPLDTPGNAKAFIDKVKPAAAFFIKYEFWFFYLKYLHEQKIPVYLVSAIFRPQQIFFRTYGRFFRNQLQYFSYFFVQDQHSADLLLKMGIRQVMVTGDTRFDRVVFHAAHVRKIDLVNDFCEDNTCIVAGSTWPADELILTEYINMAPHNLKFIIAPHEIGSAHLSFLTSKIKRSTVLYSNASLNTIREKQVLIIDNIGMLSSLYNYGKIAYIGGGFGKGIHNILEAAVFGMPVIFGPNYKKFREAREMIQLGCAFPIPDFGEFKKTIEKFLRNPAFTDRTASLSSKYVTEHKGASIQIIRAIARKLTLK
jgi:3-deoxy-D-manno-octulosonic-acid transferase